MVKFYDGYSVSGFLIEHSDGSIDDFRGQPSGTQFYRATRTDPQGNALTFVWRRSNDGTVRLEKVTDALGQNTTICYADSAEACNYGTSKTKSQITKVIDPFGRYATFTYDPTTGHLLTITDVINITSSFTYQPASDFIQTLIYALPTKQTLAGSELVSGERTLVAMG